MNVNAEKRTDTIKSQIILIDGRTCYVFDANSSLKLKSNVSVVDIYKSSGGGDEKN
jgi:hypothetical protein